MKTEIQNYFTALNEASVRASLINYNGFSEPYIRGYALSNFEGLLEQLNLTEEQINFLKIKTGFLNERHQNGQI